ncbi:unnamed protein product [Fraxinus pennsylvanica]|uniref:Transcription initiation factor IIF subunit beta n=1 Tax=Fraxinus pennsylvanica TaxID=56036 RepID=A0AAD1ZF63_9LAMI|nr:unnamed protein product [Fraxinus pennsylvanica]
MFSCINYKLYSFDISFYFDSNEYKSEASVAAEFCSKRARTIPTLTENTCDEQRKEKRVKTRKQPGCSHERHYDENLSSETYGLSFAFPIPSQYAECCFDREAELLLEFPDGTTPVTCRVSIYDSSADSKVRLGSPMDKARAPLLPASILYMEEVQVKIEENSYLWFHSLSKKYPGAQMTLLGMEQFLKEILNKVCVLRGTNQGTYQLKPEYKKSTEDTGAT